MQSARKVLSVFLMTLIVFSAAMPSFTVAAYAEYTATEEGQLFYEEEAVGGEAQQEEAVPEEIVTEESKEGEAWEELPEELEPPQLPFMGDSENELTVEPKEPVEEEGAVEPTGEGTEEPNDGEVTVEPAEGERGAEPRGGEDTEKSAEDEDAEKTVEGEGAEGTAEDEGHEELSEDPELSNLDFTSKRLIVKTDNAELLKEEHVIACLDNVYIIQYETEEAAKRAYLKLIGLCDAVEVDGVMGIAEGEMTEEENPFTEVETIIEESAWKGYAEKFDVAVIDTGSTEAEGIVSVLKDGGYDLNGHGQRMIDTIKAYAPDARILSIKAIGDEGVGDVSAVYAAIKLAIEEDVRVINLSISALKTEDSFVIEEAIAEAIARGIVVVGAAGNNGMDAGLTIPGGIEAAVIAGTTGAASNIGSTVDYFVDAKSTSYAAAMITGLILSDTLNDYEVFNRIIAAGNSEGGSVNQTTMTKPAKPTDPRSQFGIADGAGGGGSSGPISGGVGIYTDSGWAYVYYDRGGWNQTGQAGQGQASQPTMGWEDLDGLAAWFDGANPISLNNDFWVKKMSEAVKRIGQRNGTYNSSDHEMRYYYDSGYNYGYLDYSQYLEAREIIKDAMIEAYENALRSDPEAVAEGAKARIVGVAFEYQHPVGETASSIGYNDWILASYFTGNWNHQPDDFYTLFGSQYPTSEDVTGLMNRYGWGDIVDVSQYNDALSGETWRNYAFRKARNDVSYDGIRSNAHVYFIAVLDSQPGKAEPKMAPMGILLKKVDKTTGEEVGHVA